jgi:hypothetical protein
MATNRPNKKPGTINKPSTSKKVDNSKKPTFLEQTKFTPKVPADKNEIPLYDPHTGEPNPHYEELTGKPNPLLEPKKLSNDIETPKFEPKRKNRYIVTLPPHFAIQPYCVARTSRPKISVQTTNGFLSPKVKQVWEEIKIEFYDPIQPSVSERLMKIIDDFMDEPFKYTLEMLGPDGKVVEALEIGDCEITSIELGDLAYGNDDIAKCVIRFRPGYVKLKQ